MLKKIASKILKPEVVPAAQAPGAFVDHFDGQEKFFLAVRKSFGPLRQGQVDGFNAIFAEWYLRGNNDSRWLAYMFATAWHETAATMQPIVEYGQRSYFKRYDGRKDLGNVNAGDGFLFRGRGYVQLTGRLNYRKYGIESTPDKALDPAVAADIMFKGMQSGGFTGKKLGDYFNDHVSDPINARRIINGTDRAQLISQHYTHFLFALNTEPVRTKLS